MGQDFKLKAATAIPIIGIILASLLLSFKGKEENIPVPLLRDINTDKVISLKSNGTDSIYIINFWATWCKPCVEELPEFAKSIKANPNKKVSWSFISMDAYKPANRKGILSTIQKVGLGTANQFWMKDESPSKWIDKISKDWSGALPATLVIHPSSKYYKLFEKEFTQKELDSIISKF